MTVNDEANVAASTRTVEEFLDDGFRLYDVTSTNEHLLLLFEKEDKGLQVHLPASEVKRLLASDLCDRLASRATQPPPQTTRPTPMNV